MFHINAEQIDAALDYGALIAALKGAFQKDYEVPLRQHYSYSGTNQDVAATLLLMPAWDQGQDLGVKVITFSPQNTETTLPTIQGFYLLFDQATGRPKALLDAAMLTSKRTAATSGLASSLLSRPKSKSLLMIGTGALAPELIRAHAVARPIETVFVWGRNYEQATKVSDQLAGGAFSIEPVQSYEDVIGDVDIISCATLSATPLIKGALLSPGQHLDLVGSFKPDMREADDGVATKVAWFVDHYAGATKESGDLAIPLQKGIITLKDIRADLFELCRGSKPARTNADEITCFKSVGHALEDLVAAQMVYNQFKSE